MINYLKDYIALKEEIDKKDDEVKQLKERKEQMEDLLTELLIMNDIQSLDIEGKKIYLSEILFASPKNKEAFLQWLKENGEEYLITETVNSKKLSSWLHEKEENNQVIPEELLTRYYKLQLNVRKK